MCMDCVHVVGAAAENHSGLVAVCWHIWFKVRNFFHIRVDKIV